MKKTVEEWMNEWLEVYVKPCKRENTYLCYKYVIKMMVKQLPELSKLSLSEVNELSLQKLLNNSAAIYSKSTIKKMGMILRVSYNAAIRNKMCIDNPAISLEIPSASEKLVRPLTLSEEKAVIEAAKKDCLGHIIIFLLFTGLRACELRNLKWSDYNREEREIYIRDSKTKSGIRMVPLIDITYNIIESLPHYCDYIFTSTKKTPVSKTVLRKLYCRIRKATGIDIVTNHVYRHTFATRSVENKMDYKALSKILGHKNVAFTLHKYTDAQSNFLHKQMSLMEVKPKTFKVQQYTHHNNL